VDEGRELVVVFVDGSQKRTSAIVDINEVLQSMAGACESFSPRVFSPAF